MKNKTPFTKFFLLPFAALLLVANNSHAQIISNGTDIGTLATTMTLLPVGGTGTLLVNSNSVIRNASTSGISPGLRFYDSGTYSITNNGRITNSGTGSGHQAVDTAGTLNFTFVNGATGVLAINPASIYEVFRAAQPSGRRDGSLTNYGLIEGQGSGAVVTFALGGFTVHNEGTIRGGIGHWGGSVAGGTSLTINQVAGEITSNFDNSLYTAANRTTVNVSGGKMTKNLYFDGANSTSAVNLSGGEINGNLLYNKAASTNTVTVTGGSLNGNVSFGGSLGTITFNRADNYTYSNVISGNGALVQAGAGTTTLSGANTYTRVTTITNGVLQAGANGALSPQSAVIISNATLDLASTTNSIPTLVILSGTNVQSNGRLLVTTPNAESIIVASNSGSFAGYDLSGGTLRSASLANLQVGWNGTAIFNQTGGTNSIGGYLVIGRWGSSTGTYNLSDGLLEQYNGARFSIIGEDGNGTLNVSGTGVFSNASAVRIGLASGRGTLAVSNNAQFIAPGIIFGANTNNKVIFNLNYSTNYGGAISGAGSLVKDGAETLTLSSPDNTYTGTTTISNGTLVLNGTHTGGGLYTVESGATLKGEGRTASAVTVNTGGNITPGNSPGELTIGTLTLNGTLNIFIDGDSNSLLTVVGNADVTSGTVSFTTGAAPTNEVYVFLSASGSLTSPFATNSNVPAGYDLLYDATDGIAFLKLSTVTNVAEAIFSGPNAVIGSGTTNFNVYVYNGGTSALDFSVGGDGTNTFGSIASTSVPATNGVELSSLTFSNGSGTFGTNQASFNAVFDGSTNATTFDIVVYDHASNVVTGTNLTFAPVHRAAAGVVSSTNSINVSNDTNSFRIALGVTNNNTNSYLTIDTASGLEQGDSEDLFAELDLASAPLGRITNYVQLISYDDSDLSGAQTNAPGPTIEIVSYVYSGQGEWNTPGGGNWTNISQWEVEGGTPGLDGEYSVNDTAFFGTNGNGSVTNNGMVEMLSMTFSNASSPYTISGSGTITLTASGGSNSAINTLAGAHTVSNALILGSDLTLSNSAGSALDLQGVISGSSGLVKAGPGTTTLSGNNTYTGGTTVNGGQLNVAGTLFNDSTDGLRINSGVVSLMTNDVFGLHSANIRTPVTIGTGGTLQNGGAYYNALGPVTLDGGTILATTTQAAGYSFSFKDDVTVTGANTSTIAGPGIALGADGVNSTRFNVASGSTLEVTGILVDGPSATYATPQASSLTKDGLGRMIMSGANTYSGGTTLNAGTIVTASQAALGTGPVTLLGGTLELQSQLDIGSLFWDGAATIAMANPAGGQFVNIGGSLTLTNGINNFDLTGAVLPRSPVKLMTSANMSSFSTNDFGVLGLGRYSLLIDGDSLYITELLDSYVPYAVTPNQANVAAALNNFIGSEGDRGTVVAALDSLTDGQFPAAFEQLMPTPYASLPTMAFNTANALNSGMFQRLWVTRVNGRGFSSTLATNPMQAEMGGTDDMGAFAINPSKETKWGTFVDGNGIFANGGNVNYLQNYRSQSGGVSTGASYSWNDNLATGVYVGYQGLQAEYDNGRTIDNAVRFGVFGTYDIDNFYVNGLVGGAYHGYTVNRYIDFGGLDRTATGRPGAGEFDLALGTGYDFEVGNFTWGPFTTMQYTYLGVQGFTETGADSLNLDVSPYNSSSLLYTLGAQAAYNFKLSKKVLVTPTIFAGWQHEFLQNSYQINSSFTTGGPASPFAYNTGTPARDNFYGGVGATVGIGERWQATAIYSAFVGGQSQSSQNLYLGLGYKF